MSAFPLSIATSLAFESLFQGPNPPFDPSRPIPQRINLGEYEFFYCNLSTLFRNIMGSLTKEDAAGVLPREMADVLYQEIELIASLLKVEGHNTTKPIFYISDYSSLESKYASHSDVSFRRDNTDGQKHYAEQERDTFRLMVKENQNSGLITLEKAIIVPKGKPKALLLSHVAYDLVSAKNFRELHLLESHSGVLKKPNQWYTKYYGGKDLVMIPFLEGLLPVFGDSTIFRPMGIRIRKEIVELAEAKNWTAVTTRTKVIDDLKTMKNHFLGETIRALF